MEEKERIGRKEGSRAEEEEVMRKNEGILMHLPQAGGLHDHFRGRGHRGQKRAAQDLVPSLEWR